jgi:hypothetical protein
MESDVRVTQQPGGTGRIERGQARDPSPRVLTPYALRIVGFLEVGMGRVVCADWGEV